MATRRTEDMGRRYLELRAGGMKAKDAVEKVNREFKTSIHPATVRRYGADVRRKAEQEQPTTAPVDDTTPDLPHDTGPVVEEEGQAAGASTTPGAEDTTDANTGDVPRSTSRVVSGTESLTDEELQTMRDIIQWWTSNGETTMRRLETVRVEDLLARPTFPGPKKNSGIRVNTRLLEAAREKCESPEEARRSGGSISALIECLLWSYLDSDPRYLEEQPEDAPDAEAPSHRVADTSETV